jgi:hypothetical protein
MDINRCIKCGDITPRCICISRLLISIKCYNMNKLKNISTIMSSIELKILSIGSIIAKNGYKEEEFILSELNNSNTGLHTLICHMYKVESPLFTKCKQKKQIL